MAAINPIALQLGPLEIHWYAICIVTGMALAVWLAMREAPRKSMTSDDVIDFILIAFPVSILGARLYYVAFEWDYYRDHLNELLATWHGGIAIYGALLAGALVLLIFSYRRKINAYDFLDIAAPGVMLAQSFGRWGNFINQEAYGKAITHLDYLPKFIRNQMYIEGSYRVPTFLYESFWNLLGFALIMSLRHRPGLLKRGEVAWFYLVWYGCGRFVIEGMRTDSLMLAGLRVSQCLSIILVILGIAMTYYGRTKGKQPSYQQK
ncbi:prolipoprotein diacylglyceryl transferase [Streptococcus sobrinus]|uniref:prolipoprotein diacylglyceryl transferase n=2 Tax=Streptococcus sobrinus TaxID=1310 RepID=UPI0002E28C4C|nr:prolipoprotein diacylglyceryl transferase [Streptococcus sobrinus]AWN19326.1 prolipoprotein diacylglyceryl transferase [Streptococcus sobrinus]AWN61207.1 prolipoprotein diacylglyceryl transferase [Streptococcus sobrinus]AWN63080.1 prolipoprotein diacylglyceryl transferase [Streptococcus sobrinus]OZV24035.1 prolipoprotein diacylglyceryl transferase [Streptococcus sobrinus]SQG19248.1 prolipoprotein diacylglycerol transferase [Streptococcus sobrinus]